MTEHNKKIKEVEKIIVGFQESILKEYLNPKRDSLGRRIVQQHSGSSTIVRFASKVLIDEDLGCWVWIGAKSKIGYGQFKESGRRGTPKSSPHRFIYKYIYGEIPKGKEIDHLCKTRMCCNPLHLNAVTHQENQKRMQDKFCKRGHRFTNRNTYITKAGKRQCRDCSALRAKTFREKE